MVDLIVPDIQERASHESFCVSGMVSAYLLRRFGGPSTEIIVVMTSTAGAMISGCQAMEEHVLAGWQNWGTLGQKTLPAMLYPWSRLLPTIGQSSSSHMSPHHRAPPRLVADTVRSMDFIGASLAEKRWCGQPTTALAPQFDHYPFSSLQLLVTAVPFDASS